MATTNVVHPEPFEPWDDCVCGRKMGQVHCPFCGSQNNRAVPSKNHEATLPNGNVILNKVFNCRKCGNYFDTRARLECRAPSQTISRRELAKAEQAAKAAKPLDPQSLSPEVMAVLNKWKTKLQE